VFSVPSVVKNGSAQRVSKVSEMPEGDGKTGRTEKTGNNGGVAGKSDETSAQRHSKVSEYGGARKVESEKSEKS